MDTSKLPKFSQTPAPPPPEPDAASPVGLNYAPPDPKDFAGGAAAAWISFIVGLILLFAFPRLLEYMFGRSTWTFSAEDGSPLPYTKTVFFWGDVAIYAFILVLFAEGLIILLARKTALVGLALLLTIAATLLNLGFIIYMYQHDQGLQLVSALAVAFGGYICITEWKLLAITRAWRKAYRSVK